MDFSDPATHSTHKKTKAALFISWLFWIEESPKMSYKVNFKPVEGYVDKNWQILAIEKNKEGS